MDNRSVPHDPLYRAFRAKSFTANDITLHFYLLDLLSDEMPLTVKQIVERLSAEYFSHFEDYAEPDESTIRKKLKEYERLGLLEGTRLGRENAYRRAPDLVDREAWRSAISFFSEADPMGVIGSYLLDRMEPAPDRCYTWIADVYDALEVLPWIRTFIGKIVRLTCTNKAVLHLFAEDLEAMRALYGGDGHAVQ